MGFQRGEAPLAAGGVQNGYFLHVPPEPGDGSRVHAGCGFFERGAGETFFQKCFPRSSLRDDRPGLHASGAAVADGYFAAFDDQGHFAFSTGEFEHFLKNLGVGFDVFIAVARVRRPGVFGVGSALFAVDDGLSHNASFRFERVLVCSWMHPLDIHSIYPSQADRSAYALGHGPRGWTRPGLRTMKEPVPDATANP